MTFRVARIGSLLHDTVRRRRRRLSVSASLARRAGGSNAAATAATKAVSAAAVTGRSDSTTGRTARTSQLVTSFLLFDVDTMFTVGSVHVQRLKTNTLYIYSELSKLGRHIQNHTGCVKLPLYIVTV